jgi:CBS domain-containing protein
VSGYCGKEDITMMDQHSQSLQSVMTTDVTSLPPSASVFQAAKQMKELNVGAIPICDGRHLIGMLTDRDIVVRLVAEQRDPSEQVHTIMSGQVDYCYEDQDADEAVHIMQDRQIRRLPIVNRERELIGIVSLGDLAVKSDTGASGEALEQISQPAKPMRPAI